MPSNNENGIAPTPFADLTSATILTTLAVAELAYDTYQNNNLDIKSGGSLITDPIEQFH
jgi:hypothetical protein